MNTQQPPMMNMPNMNGFMPMPPGGMMGKNFPFPGNGMQINPSAISTDNSLYVGNLHPSMNNMGIFSEFNQYGNVVSCRLMKNTYTGESRGFAFVTFANKSEATKAQIAMNNKVVFDREIRVYFKKNMKDLNENANLVVKNLHKDITSKQLNEECAKYGNAISCFVKKEEVNGKMVSLGYGYVQFSSEEEANKFFEEFNGKIINGMDVKVERFIPYKNRKKPEISNLYIKNFSSKLETKEQVENFITEEMGKCGEITSKGVFKVEKLNKFYAFVAFKEVANAKDVIEKFNGQKDEGSTDEPLYVSLAQNKRTRQKMLEDQKLKQKNLTNMYIRSLKNSVTEEEMKRVFSKYGNILSFCLKEWKRYPKAEDEKNENMPQLKFGFVNYEKEEEAVNLMSNYKKDEEIMNMVQIPNNNSTFIFYAQPKKLRIQYLRMNKKNQMTFNYMKMINPNFQHMMKNKGGYPKNPKAMEQFMHNKTPMVNQIENMNPHGNFIVKQKSDDNLQRALESATIPISIQIINKRLEEFEKLDDEFKKNILGHIMYERVKTHVDKEDLVPKITGMLIDLDVLTLEEIIEIIDNEESLKERITEAIDVLENNDEEEED